MKITMRHLQTVRELARTHSFTEAAARLHTTQSNVSLALREIESLLGTRLFERSTKHFHLTEAGAAFVPVVERMLGDLQAGVDNVVASVRLQKGVLAIGGTPLLTATLLSELLGDYQRRYPSIELRVEDTSTAELTRQLRNRSIELALGTFSTHEADLTVLPLFEDPLVVLAHASRHLPQACTWRDLAQWPLVSIVRSSSVGQLIDDTVRSVTDQPYRPTIELHHWSTVITLTESLAGICIVPDYAARKAAGGPLKKVELLEPRVLRTISVAYLRNRELSAAGKAFLELVRADVLFKRDAVPGAGTPARRGNDSTTASETAAF